MTTGRIKLWAASLLLLTGLAFAPRVIGLNQFLGPDELAQQTRTVQFLTALSVGDWAGTMIGNDSGNLPLMWVGSLGLLRYDQPADAPLAAMRLTLAIANGVLVLLTFYLLQRLWSLLPALLATALLALDPLLLSESRMLRSEALYTAFMGLSVLAVLLHLRGQPWMLLLSGVLGGLALASKVSGVFLIGFVPLVLMFYHGYRQWRGWLWDSLRWGATVGITFVMLWPALLLRPVATLSAMIRTVYDAGIQGRVAETFFMGQLWRDLPGYYYLLVTPYRLTPLALVGVVLALGWLGYRWVKKHPDTREYPVQSVGVLLAFAGLYLLMFSLAANKTDRYILTSLWALNVITGMGWGYLLRWLGDRARWAMPIALVMLLGWQSYSVARIHPYYTAYYSELLGGLPRAASIFQLGYGEGVAAAMDYLNRQPNAAQIRLVCGTNAPRCEQHFIGETWQSRTLNPVNGRWMQADYVLIYVNALQRRLYPAGVVPYLERQPPAHTVAIDGVTYARLYRLPSVSNTGEAATLTGFGTLLGYTFDPGTPIAGESLGVHAYWQSDHTDAPLLHAVLVDGQGYAWAAGALPFRPGFEQARQTRQAVLESAGVLTLPVGMPAGTYTLRLGFAAAQEMLTFEHTASLSIKAAPLPHETPTVRQPHGASVADGLRLVGHNLNDTTVTPGESVWLPLVWQAEQDITRAYRVILHLTHDTQSDTPLATWQAGYGPWQAGQVVQDPWRLDLPATLDLGSYTLNLTLLDDTTGAEIYRGRVHSFEVVAEARPAMQAALDTPLGEGLTLLGYDLYFDVGPSGDSLTPTLYWRIHGQDIETADYALAMSLYAADRDMVVQHWTVPLAPNAPRWYAHQVMSAVYRLETAPLQGPYHLDIALLRGGEDVGAPVRLENIQTQVQVRVAE